MWNTLQHWSIIFNLVFLVLPWERKWCVVWWHSGRSEEFHLCYNVTNFHTISLRRKRKFRNERSQRRNFFLAQKWLLWLWPPYLWKVEICSRPQNLLLGNGGIFLWVKRLFLAAAVITILRNVWSVNMVTPPKNSIGTWWWWSTGF